MIEQPFDNSASLSSQHLHNFKEGVKEIVGEERVHEVMTTWTYAGGQSDDDSLTDAKKHINHYEKIKHTLRVLPPFPCLNNCVCGHWIVVNCYIVSPDKTELIVCGSCCIKKFVDNKFNKTCETCNEFHKSRKDNFCKKCQKNNKELVKKKEKQEKRDKKEQEKRDREEEERKREQDEKEERIKQYFIDNFISLTISYDNKERAKALGAKWSTEFKTWYIPFGHRNTSELQNIGKFITLLVPFSEKDDAKELGCKWNKELRVWTTSTDNPNLEEILDQWDGKL